MTISAKEYFELKDRIKALEEQAERHAKSINALINVLHKMNNFLGGK